MNLFILSVALFLFASPASAAIEIVECGAEIPENETAYLGADLDCSDADSEGVILSNGARLFLSGHRLISNPGEDASRQGVRCRTGSVCSIVGPGEITGFSASGIAGTRVRARDVVVSGNAVAGIIAYEDVHLNNVTVEGNGVFGVRAGGKITQRGVDRAGVSEGDLVQSRAPRFRPDRHSRRADPRDG
jgi:hypothetical protein